jgi:hypothetical protein
LLNTDDKNRKIYQFFRELTQGKLIEANDENGDIYSLEHLCSTYRRKKILDIILTNKPINREQKKNLEAYRQYLPRLKKDMEMDSMERDEIEGKHTSLFAH